MQSALRLPSVWAHAPRACLSSMSTAQAGPSDPRPKPAVEEPVEVKPGRREKTKPNWMIHKEAIRRNFPEGWNPPKKISRPSMALLRTLHKTDPLQFSLPVLADKFKISPEAVRRILKSKWEPTPPEADHPPSPPTSAQNCSDGWVHHEKSDTQTIPVNLAQALQSSLPSHFYTPAPTFNHPQPSHPSTVTATGRARLNEPRSRFADPRNRRASPSSAPNRLARPHTHRLPPDDQPPQRPNSQELGSAFHQETRQETRPPRHIRSRFSH